MSTIGNSYTQISPAKHRYDTTHGDTDSLGRSLGWLDGFLKELADRTDSELFDANEALWDKWLDDEGTPAGVTAYHKYEAVCDELVRRGLLQRG